MKHPMDASAEPELFWARKLLVGPTRRVENLCDSLHRTGRELAILGYVIFLMDPFSKQVGEKNTKRRSQRMLIGLPVSVVLARPSQKPILEHTKTLAVNAHGALVLLAMKLSAGDLVMLINPQTKEEQPSRVVFIGSRESEKQEVAIEFVKPSPLFWRIAFPPRDWTPLHKDAKGFSKRVAPQPKDLKNQ